MSAPKQEAWKADCGFHGANPSVPCSVRAGEEVIKVRDPAKARLIAAAPDLLEAASEGLICAEADVETRRLENNEDGTDDATDATLAVFIARRDLIRAALAKATGEGAS